MLNAMELGTFMPIHRHRNSSETMIVVKGSLKDFFMTTRVMPLESGCVFRIRTALELISMQASWIIWFALSRGLHCLNSRMDRGARWQTKISCILIVDDVLCERILGLTSNHRIAVSRFILVSYLLIDII